MRSLASVVQPDPGEHSHLLPLPDQLFYMNHMERQANMAAHHHPSLEIAIVLGGNAIHRTAFGDSPCKPGQVLLIPPGVWHAYGACRTLELYNCILSQPLLDGPLVWAAEDSALRLILKPDRWHGSSQVLTFELPQSALPEVRGLLAQLHSTYGESPGVYRVKLVAELLLLLDFIARRSSPMHETNAEVIHSAVQRAVQQLRADLAKAWSLPQLAAQLRINPSYLVRIFRQAIGCAPMKFLARERAHQAAQLLLTTSLPISEIGSLVGWDEPKQFARSFRQHFAESASEFRRRMTQG